MSRRAVLRHVEGMFAAAGLAEPRADAQVLVEEATGLDRSGLLTGGGDPLGAGVAATLAGFVKRRLAREPVFRIIGRRPFWTLELRVTPAVLDPRPDTETVVAAALAAMAGRHAAPLQLLDLGTGSGAILCALLAECPIAIGIGIDRSLAACAVARDNLAACGSGDRSLVVAADWAAPLAGEFDLVVANPPYIETAAIPGLDPEVRDHDPRAALDGGADGLEPYRTLAPSLPGLLRPGGAAVMEVGWSQAEAVAALFAAAGLVRVAAKRDGGGHFRAVVGHRA